MIHDKALWNTGFIMLSKITKYMLKFVHQKDLLIGINDLAKKVYLFHTRVRTLRELKVLISEEKVLIYYFVTALSDQNSGPVGSSTILSCHI